jgi:hypothetical protein
VAKSAQLLDCSFSSVDDRLAIGLLESWGSVPVEFIASQEIVWLRYGDSS